MAEERELLRNELSETWIDECKYPDDTDFGNYRRHFGYGAPGGRHLTWVQVLDKYNMYVLKLAENEPLESLPTPIPLIGAKTQRVKNLIPLGPP